MECFRPLCLAARLLLPSALALAACASPAGGGDGEVLARFPLDDLAGVLTTEGVTLDREISSDGGGSLRITASGPRTVRLFEVSGLDVEQARLLYTAKLRTEDAGGPVFLEMWCVFPERGEYFSRGLHAPLSGTRDWTTQAIPFFLQAGQNPSSVKLNLVLAGRGTVWIDDITLSRAALP